MHFREQGGRLSAHRRGELDDLDLDFLEFKVDSDTQGSVRGGCYSDIEEVLPKMKPMDNTELAQISLRHAKDAYAIIVARVPG